MGDEALLMKTAELIESLPDEALCSHKNVFKLVWELEAEVNNGGFQQYFLNSSGRNALRAAKALKELGAEKCAALVERALDAVNAAKIHWENDSSRQTDIENLDESKEEALSEIDEAFYQYPDNLSDLLTAYVTSHQVNFGI